MIESEDKSILMLQAKQQKLDTSQYSNSNNQSSSQQTQIQLQQFTTRMNIG